MEPAIGTRVVGEAGLRGEITNHVVGNDGAPAMLVTLDDGTQVQIPTSLLVMQTDGSAQVALRREDIAQAQSSFDSEERVIPVIAEELQVGKRTVERGRVRVRKLVHQRDEVVDQPLVSQQIEVTRVAINQPITDLPQVRQEGDTTIIPVIEEVLVVEKRLLLKEEVHITRRQTTLHEPQTVTLRSEEIVVERLPSTNEDVPDEA